MSVLRVFSYLPNPRVWKATVAGRLAGVEVEVIGASQGELKDWLWDFNARPMTDADRANPSLARTGKVGFNQTLYKTDAFLEAHPFGTVPAAFSPDGQVGIFESNSIMRAVARVAGPASGLYGRDAYEASRIDSFLDVALVFARDAQLYLFSTLDKTLDEALHSRASAAFDFYMSGVEKALGDQKGFIVGDQLTLADICFVAELALFSNERTKRALLDERKLAPIFRSSLAADYPRAWQHFQALAARPEFAVEFGPYLKKIEAAAAA